MYSTFSPCRGRWLRGWSGGSCSPGTTGGELRISGVSQKERKKVTCGETERGCNSEKLLRLEKWIKMEEKMIHFVKQQVVLCKQYGLFCVSGTDSSNVSKNDTKHSEIPWPICTIWLLGLYSKWRKQGGDIDIIS